MANKRVAVSMVSRSKRSREDLAEQDRGRKSAHLLLLLLLPLTSSSPSTLPLSGKPGAQPTSSVLPKVCAFVTSASNAVRANVSPEHI